MRSFTLILLLLAVLPPTAQSAKLTGPDGFKMHPGDVLTIRFRLTPAFDQAVTVLPNGQISLLGITTGGFQVAGLTLEQVTAEIVARSASELKEPEVSVAVTQTPSRFFVVAGEVAAPGKFELREPTTAIQAVMLAGGWKNTAKTKHVVVFRRLSQEDAQTIVLDLHGMRLGHDPEGDIELVAGDMLYVPRSKLSGLERIVKLANLGVFFNPVGQL